MWFNVGRNLYPYSRYISRYTAMCGVITTGDRHFWYQRVTTIHTADGLFGLSAVNVQCRLTFRILYEIRRMGIFVVSLIISKTGLGPFFGSQLSKCTRWMLWNFKPINSFYSQSGEIITLAKVSTQLHPWACVLNWASAVITIHAVPEVLAAFTPPMMTSPVVSDRGVKIPSLLN